jgi:hypothetical protein
METHPIKYLKIRSHMVICMLLDGATPLKQVLHLQPIRRSQRILQLICRKFFSMYICSNVIFNNTHSYDEIIKKISVVEQAFKIGLCSLHPHAYTDIKAHSSK